MNGAIGSIYPDLDGGLHLVVDEGKTIPYPHGEWLDREEYPELYHAIAYAQAVPTTERGVLFPDLRGRVIQPGEDL